MSRTRAALVALAALLPAAFVFGAGCSAILNPENSDEILRCGNADECVAYDEIAAALESQRTQPACRSKGASSEFGASDRDQVCSVVDKEIRCDLAKQNPTDPGRIRWDEAQDSTGVYIACAMDKQGSRGCKPKAGNVCDAGLEVNQWGACDAPGANLAVEPNPEMKGLDVADQFCRSYFCDADVPFACGADKICRRCDPTKELGKGGCAELFFSGAPSPVYVDDSCPPRAAVSTVEIGPLPPPALP